MEKSNEDSNFLSHSALEKNFQSVFDEKKEKIIKIGNIPQGTVEEQLSLLQQLSEFELGRSLLINRGLDGYWSSYVVLYRKRSNELNVTHPLEKLLLERIFYESQVRFELFQSILQKHLKNGIKICSVPCGLMDVLLTLNYKGINDIKLIGIDIDEKSIEKAKENTIKHNLVDKTELKILDAWKLDVENEYDVLESHGLNIYVTDNEKLIRLYEIFYRAIKPGGILVISSMQAPTNNFSPEELQSGKFFTLLFNHIIEVAWWNFAPISETISKLKGVGFKNIEVVPCENKVFKTFSATK